MSSKLFAVVHGKVFLQLIGTSTVFRTGMSLAYWRSVGNFAAFVLGFALIVFPFEANNFL